MSKQKLAEMVLQKMQQKKQRQQKNRPHRQVLQLLVKFQVEDYQQLRSQIEEITKQLQAETEVLRKLEEFNQQFENTGKKEYPRIIVKPEFIASQYVEPAVKQFYRKASNTYLRQDLLKKKQYEIDLQRSQEIQKAYADLRDKEVNLTKQKQVQHIIYNEKRVRNLKQDLRLRALKQEQQNIKKTIAEQKHKYRDLIAQYQLKKVNLHQRVEWSEKLIVLIQNQKQIIQKAYNPVTYRQYLKKIFNIRTKNQAMQKNLIQATQKVHQIEKQTEKKSQFLQKNDGLFVQGRTSDSPSRRKGYSVGSLGKDRTHKKITPKHSSLLFNLKKSVESSFASPQKSLNKNKSFSTSVGKTTASSMSNLLKNSSLDKGDFNWTASSFKSNKKRGTKMFH